MIFYRDIFEFDIVMMNEVIRKYGIGNEAWKLFYEFYKDPDGYAINEKGLRTRAGIECTVDGLLSVNRIYKHEGFNKQFIDSFIIYREVPIIFFPRERGGINTSRFSKFGDRIDHTLYDLKQYYEKNECKLEASYKLPKTQLWLKSFNNFGEMVRWMHIDGIFVDKNDNVFDLEKNNETIILDYCKQYDRSWSNTYYNNVKEKIKEFREKNIFNSPEFKGIKL